MTRFRFADPEEGREILSARDAFVARLSRFDRMARMGSAVPVGEDRFLGFLRACVVPWSPEEKEAGRRALDLVAPLLESLPLPLPEEVPLVRTNGREEGGGTYTRGNAVVLPPERVDPFYEEKRRSDQSPLHELLLHELFHVATRFRPALRDALYGALGYRRCGEILLPPGLAERRITNPDAPGLEHCARYEEAGRAGYALPLLFAERDFDPGRETSFFAYLRAGLLEVEPGDGGMRAVMDGDGHARFRPEGPGGGDAREPEEVLAERYTELAVRRGGRPETGIDVRIAEVLKEER